MNEDQRREYQAAMDNATNNPRDLPDHPIDGLPSDPLDLRAHLMWLDAQWDRGNGKAFREDAKRSFKEWVNGGDGLGPWRD